MLERNLIYAGQYKLNKAKVNFLILAYTNSDTCVNNTAILRCLAGRMWPKGRTLPRPGLKNCIHHIAFKENFQRYVISLTFISIFDYTTKIIWKSYKFDSAIQEILNIDPEAISFLDYVLGMGFQKHESIIHQFDSKTLSIFLITISW